MGNFKEGKKLGIGQYLWKDGSKYYGEWKNNSMCGYGIFYFNDNRIYRGEWDNNMMNGFGEYIWNGGEKKYVGYFLNDNKNGFGIFYFKDFVKIYIGFWVNGKQSGIGKYINLAKEKYGIWNDGKKIKKVNIDEIEKYIEPEYKQFLPFFHYTLEELKKIFMIFEEEEEE